MLHAWVGDQRCAPLTRGERTTCRDSLIAAVMSVEKGTGCGGCSTARFGVLLEETVHPSVGRDHCAIQVKR